MKKIFSILIISIFFKQSYALECKACEATDSDASCELSYECDKGAKYCETLVSKVEGSYSIVMSCATEEKCDAKAILKDGLDECNHDDDNTECYSCCKGDSCNTLESALENLPEDIFENENDEKPAKKGKKSKGKKKIDDEEEENEEEINEELEESDDEEDEKVEKKKVEKKKSKDKKSKNKEEEPEDNEDTDEVNQEEPEEKSPEELEEKNSEEPEEGESEKESIITKKVDENVASNNSSVDVVAENGTVIEKSAENKTVIVTNITSNATEEGNANNNEVVEVLSPLDPNIEEIDKKLNETGVVVEDLPDNLENAENTENVENTAVDPENIDPKTLDENSANNAEIMEETKVQDGIEFNVQQNPEDILAPENEANSDENANGDSTIITQGENANEVGEQHELFDAPSSSRKYQTSEILFSAVLILILIQLF